MEYSDPLIESATHMDTDSPHLGPPEIHASEIETVCVLGDGSFGTVRKGRCRAKDVAVKVLHLQDLDENALLSFRKEVEIVSKIFHPNIVLFMGACTVPGNMMIVTELMPKGDLETILQDSSIHLGLLTRMKMAKDAALGMTWLHGSNPQFIHRDFKTSNLLVDENNRIKICDFGLSQIKKQGEKLLDGKEGAKGTPLWMAPEVLAGREFSEKADIYSFGVVLWEILTREEPFKEFATFEEFREAVCLKHARPNIPPKTHPSIERLIECCWQPNPESRPSFPEIITALDHIIVDCAILDEIGRRIWKERFLNREYVDWKQFVESFIDVLDYYGDTTYQLLPANPPADALQTASEIQLIEFSSRSPNHSHLVNQEYMRRQNAQIAPLEADLKLVCLKILVAETPKGEAQGSDQIVQIEKFGNMLVWFGPIVDYATRKVVLLDTIYSVLSKAWFHGDIGQVEAENRLAKRQVGTFLVRFSSIVGCFTISKVCGRAITHQRIIHRVGQGFSVNHRTSTSLVHLIEHYSTDLGLSASCPGSRYLAELFNDQVMYSGYIVS